MVIFRFKSNEEHEELLRKVRKMKKFAAEIEDCLEEHMEGDETNYRYDGRRYEDDDYDMRGSRYDYRRGIKRM